MGCTPLHIACGSTAAGGETGANPEAVIALVKAGADVNASDSNGDAALYHMAIQATKPGAHDWCAAFDSLIAAGAYVDAQQSVAEITPLMKLCMNANESVADRPPEAALALLKRFLDAGADPNAVDEGALEAVPALDGASL